MEPRVSIIITNHNYAAFVRDAIDSALGQTHSNLEVLVVDDGSTDESRTILRQYAGRVLVLEKNHGGQASAFHAGFRASTGEIVLFLDADDCLDPTAIAAVVRAWKPGVAKVQFRLRLFGQPGIERYTVPRSAFSLPSGNMVAALLASGGYVTPPTSGNAFSRNVLAQILPLDEEEWPIAADLPLVIRAAFYGDVISLENIFGSYRVHDRNHWHKNDAERERLQMQLHHNAKREALVRLEAARCGLQPARDLLLHNPLHVELSLIELFQGPGDRIRQARLSLCAVRNAFVAPQSNARRAMDVGFYATLSWLPKAWAARLFDWRTRPMNRPRVFTRLTALLTSRRRSA